jgi:hypothetical protein
MTGARRRGVVILAGLVLPALLSACTSAPGPIQVDPSSTPPPGPYLTIDTAGLSADHRTLTLTYIGGPEGDAADPCSSDSTVWARADGEQLIAAAVSVDRGASPARILADTMQGEGSWGCDLVGHAHTRQVLLPEPFDGAVLRDLGGGAHFVARPSGLVEIGPLPDGWTLATEGEVAGSASPRWRRIWTSGGRDPKPESLGKLQLYQSFGGPVEVGGGEEQRTVTVNGQAARLVREAADGELVLTWSLGTDGLALASNEQDFPLDDLIRLAESARAPAS